MDKELEYLNLVNKTLEQEKKYLEEQIIDKTETVNELQHFISEHFYTMDIPEIAQQNCILNEEGAKLEFLNNNMKSIKLQQHSPYFGKFRFDNSMSEQDYYIGLRHLEGASGPLVYDWRAPVSSMFYDYELGQASYNTIDKQQIKGIIKEKKQFKIVDGVMKYSFDSSLTINDEILQQELSKNASEKMKNIASTIQNEQNKLIRDDEIRNVIVNGVAGSGKTAIALHRAAYLLYKHRDTIKAEDILILSPSSAFSSYISNVLPELGESNIMECTFSRLSESELKGLIELEDRETMLDALFEDEQRQKTISFKSSFSFLNNLTKYAKDTLLKSFEPEDIKLMDKTVKKEYLKSLFLKKFSAEQTISVRINYIASEIADSFNLEAKLMNDVTERLKRILYSYFPTTNIIDIYKCFLLAQELPVTFDETLPYEDIPSVLFLKYYMFGLNYDVQAKYLIIDEMQDYTPVHFYLFKKLWDAPVMLLGDINQCIEKNITENYIQLLCKFYNAELITLNKTYRSTKQITSFANSLIGIKTEMLNRDGQEVSIHECLSSTNVSIKELMDQMKGYNSVAIITKTNSEAKKLYLSFKDKSSIELLESKMSYQGKKFVITSVALSKGLEFDAVIAANATKACYKNTLDKKCLYVLSTRALHELHFIYKDNLTRFINIKA